jgi:hypothetical protein
MGDGKDSTFKTHRPTEKDRLHDYREKLELSQRRSGGVAGYRRGLGGYHFLIYFNATHL